MLSIQEAEAASNPHHQDKSAFKVVRQVGGQSSKRRKTEGVVVPQVHTFGTIEVGAFFYTFILFFAITLIVGGSLRSRSKRFRMPKTLSKSWTDWSFQASSLLFSRIPCCRSFSP